MKRIIALSLAILAGTATTTLATSSEISGTPDAAVVEQIKTN